MIHSDPLTLDDEAFLTRARDMCTTKVPYVNRPAATAALRRGSYTGTPYRCPICDAWHTTTYDRVRSKRFSRRLSRLLRETV